MPMLPTGQALTTQVGQELFAAQTLTVSGNSNVFAPDKNTLVCHLVVSGAVTGTSPNMVIKLQDSPDGVNWVDIPSAAFSAVTSSGNVQRLVVSNVGANVRAVATITGITPSFAGVTLSVQSR